MLTIGEYSVSFVKDPFGILSGKRYEFLINIELDEEDELFSSKGIYLRVLYSVEETGNRIVKQEFIEKETEVHLDFELEDDEEELVKAFCLAHYTEAD